MNKFTKKGFTLVELLIFMGIFSLLIFIIVDIFSSALETNQEIQSFSVVQQDGSYIISRLQYDISRAQTITIPASLGTQTTSLQVIVDGTTHTYQLNSDNLLLTDPTGTNQLNSFDTVVSNISFTRVGNVGGKNTIKLAFTLASKTQRPQGPEIKNFQTTIGLR